MTIKNLYVIFKIRKEKIDMKKEKLQSLIMILLFIDIMLLANESGGFVYYSIVVGIMIILGLLLKKVGGFDE